MGMNIEREHLNLVHLCFHAVSSMVSLQWYGCLYGDDLAGHTQSCFWAFLLLVPDITSALATSSKFRAATPFQHFTQTYMKNVSSLTCSHTRSHKVETLEILFPVHWCLYTSFLRSSLPCPFRTAPKTKCVNSSINKKNMSKGWLKWFPCSSHFVLCVKSSLSWRIFSS